MSSHVLLHEHTRGGVRAQDNGTFSDLEEMSILGRAVAFARASAGRLGRLHLALTIRSVRLWRELETPQ